MWARFNHWQLPADDMDAAIAEAQKYVEELKPQKRQEPGYRGMYSFVDREAGRGITVTLWDGEDDLRASEGAAAQQRDAGVARAGGAQAGVDRFEVIDVDLT